LNTIIKEQKKMRIRTGFVSNSSSSSFCIFGTATSIDLSKLFNKDIDEDSDEYNYDWSDTLAGELGNGFIVRRPEGYDDYFVGLSWPRIGEDETSRQFKQRIQDRILEVFKAHNIPTEDLKFQTHQETFYS